MAAGRQVLADIVRPDGNLAVAPVNQHGKLRHGGAAQVHQRAQGGADGAARVNHFVHQDQPSCLQYQREFAWCRLWAGRCGNRRGTGRCPDCRRERACLRCARWLRQALGQRRAFAKDADDGQVFGRPGSFPELHARCGSRRGAFRRRPSRWRRVAGRVRKTSGPQGRGGKGGANKGGNRVGPAWGTLPFPPRRTGLKVTICGIIDHGAENCQPTVTVPRTTVSENGGRRSVVKWRRRWDGGRSGAG